MLNHHHILSRPGTSGRVQPGTLALAFVVAMLLIGLGLLLRKSGQESNPAPAAVANPEVARTNLVLSEGRLCLKADSNIFTGLMLEHFPNGTLRSRSFVSNGLLHGLSQGWFTNAHLQVSETFQAGVSHGLRTKWYPSGAKLSEAAIAKGQLHGPYRKWHENGALSEQAEFVAGQPEGVSLSYYPSGSLKARVLMKNGQATEQSFWKDGEKRE